jgi:dinuclear metal center YbgI/SA1388 family protein
MITCSDIIAYFEETAPSQLAEEWDNIGLLVGNKKDKVERILLCMDVTSASLKEAINKRADLIINHHPVLFRAIKKVVEGEGNGSLLHGLIKNNINVFTAHTNLDYVDNGVNARLAQIIGLKDFVVIGKGPGRVGILESVISLEEFAFNVKRILKSPAVRVIGEPKNAIKRVAVFSGSFDDNIEEIMKANADVLVTGDVKYHTALDAIEAGLCIIDAGHFYTERVILKPLKDALKLKFPDVTVFCFTDEKDPFTTI